MHTPMNQKILRYFKDHPDLPSPCMVLDVDVIKEQYDRLTKALHFTECRFAIKANPAKEVLTALIERGSGFDVASLNEIQQCLDLGADPSKLIYANTIKKESSIRKAYEQGVRLFTFDCEEELHKISRAAPGADVMVRIRTSGKGAVRPLAKKFGCTPKEARRILYKSSSLGLNPTGITFHVGSQMTDPHGWDDSLKESADLFKEFRAEGIELDALNIGGGFPADYWEQMPSIEEIGAVIHESFNTHFQGIVPKLVMCEPGRFIVSDAAMIQSEIVLITTNREADHTRWIFLDMGRYTGMSECLTTHFVFRCDKEDDPISPVVIAGPTCDSKDVIYERGIYELPDTLEIGDKIWVQGTGAYTDTISSVGFNGFTSLPTYCI